MIGDAKLLIFDFDGTLTDAEVEGAPFRGGYLDDVATICGVPACDVLELAEALEAEIACEPQRYGWVFGGQVVAPATVDPYLRMMPVARKVMDRYSALMDADVRDRVLDGILYKYNYGKTRTAFREGARALLCAMARERTFIVTNSHTDAVQAKVRLLSQRGEREGGVVDDPHALLWLAERVHGRARKYVVDPGWDAIPEALELPGLSRPVLLRRRAYFEVIDQLRGWVGASWEDTVVIGDIFELDLALPLALGARVVLMRNEHTPPWELDYLAKHPRASIAARCADLSVG
jgi:hypothetical protein